MTASCLDRGHGLAGPALRLAVLGWFASDQAERPRPRSHARVRGNKTARQASADGPGPPPWLPETKFRIFLFKGKNVSISLRLNKQDVFILEKLKTHRKM